MEKEEEHESQLVEISDEEDTGLEIDDNIELDDVKTVLKISDLCSFGETKTLYNARHARKGRMDCHKELSCITTKWISGPQPQNISWWLAIMITFGSMMFVISGVINFFGNIKDYHVLISFSGAILWSIGGFLSYFEVINAVNNVNEHIQITRICAFRLQQVDWWIGVSTFFGTLFIQASLFMISFLDSKTFSIPLWTLLYNISIILGCVIFIASSILQLAEGSGKAKCLTWNPREPWFWNAILFILGSLSWIFMCIARISNITYNNVIYILYLIGSVFYFMGSYALVVEVQN